MSKLHCNIVTSCMISNYVNSTHMARKNSHYHAHEHSTRRTISLPATVPWSISPVTETFFHFLSTNFHILSAQMIHKSIISVPELAYMYKCICIWSSIVISNWLISFVLRKKRWFETSSPLQKCKTTTSFMMPCLHIHLEDRAICYHM